MAVEKYFPKKIGRVGHVVGVIKKGQHPPSDVHACPVVNEGGRGWPLCRSDKYQVRDQETTVGQRTS